MIKKRGIRCLKISIVVVSFLCTLYAFKNNSGFVSESGITKVEKIKNKGKPHIEIFDLSSPLEPVYVYEDIKCRSSAKVYVETTLCVHDLKKDVWVSASIWKNGIWERDIIETFLSYVNTNPDWLVFDVGGNVAKMNRTVVTVEPFYDNILRIHKASRLANVHDRITLFKNGIGDQRNKIIRLNPVNDNIGGQSLLENKNKQFEEDNSDKYLVRTVFFDDLIDYLPMKNDGKSFEQAVLKIDIEGFEPLAFANASQLFKKIQFNIIFMEFRQEFLLYHSYQQVNNMLEFLSNNNMVPYAKNKILYISQWKSWPSEIIWKRNGF